MNSHYLNTYKRVGPKRLANFLSRLVPTDSGLLIQFDVLDYSRETKRKLERQLTIWCGRVEQKTMFGPASEHALQTWTVRFYRQQSAEMFLKAVGVLRPDVKLTLADFMVKEGK